MVTGESREDVRFALTRKPEDLPVLSLVRLCGDTQDRRGTSV